VTMANAPLPERDKVALLLFLPNRQPVASDWPPLMAAAHWHDGQPV
jgi:hypothetical protein